MNIFDEVDYKRFKNEFTTKVPVSRSLANFAKGYVARVDKAGNKKQMIKALKQEVLDSAYRKLWILKVLKLFYVFLDPSNFVNGDSYLYFILAPILKPLLLQDTRNRLVFGESNLKVKAVEINRYLDDDERRFAGPKIDVVLIDNK